MNARFPSMMWRAVVALGVLALTCVHAGDTAVVVPFSTQLPTGGVPAGWTVVTFRNKPRHTEYALVREGDTVVVRAQAFRSAAALTCRVGIALEAQPFLRWRWKIDHLLSKSDMTHKQGDDYPARVYVTFSLDPRASFAERLRYRAAQAMYGKDVPYAALNYVWDTRTAAGSLVLSAYTDRVRMIVLESGPAHVGQWIDEQRNVYEDYRKAFGTDPPPVSAVAIMTDTDDTGESALAWYGDIALESAVR